LSFAKAAVDQVKAMSHSTSAIANSTNAIADQVVHLPDRVGAMTRNANTAADLNKPPSGFMFPADIINSAAYKADNAATRAGGVLNAIQEPLDTVDRIKNQARGIKESAERIKGGFNQMKELYDNWGKTPTLGVTRGLIYDNADEWTGDRPAPEQREDPEEVDDLVQAAVDRAAKNAANMNNVDTIQDSSLDKAQRGGGGKAQPTPKPSTDYFPTAGQSVDPRAQFGNPNFPSTQQYPGSGGFNPMAAQEAGVTLRGADLAAERKTDESSCANGSCVLPTTGLVYNPIPNQGPV
jgi:hypothetical protein